MEKRYEGHRLARYLIGYLIGFCVFFLAIPYGLHAISRGFHAFETIPYLTDLPLGGSARLACALIAGSIGLFFLLWSNAALIIQGKGGPTDAFNVAISPRTKHLVVGGPYRYTRNPMVFGAFSFYVALAVYWNSLPALMAPAAFSVAVRFYLRATEEKRLLRDFGKEYEEYRKTVAMIVPWPAGRKR